MLTWYIKCAAATLAHNTCTQNISRHHQLQLTYQESRWPPPWINHWAKYHNHRHTPLHHFRHDVVSVPGQISGCQSLRFLDALIDVVSCRPRGILLPMSWGCLFSSWQLLKGGSMIVAAVVTAAQEFMANEWPSWTKHTARQKESCVEFQSSVAEKYCFGCAEGYRCAFLVVGREFPPGPALLLS